MLCALRVCGAICREASAVHIEPHSRPDRKTAFAVLSPYDVLQIVIEPNRGTRQLEGDHLPALPSEDRIERVPASDCLPFSFARSQRPGDAETENSLQRYPRLSVRSARYKSSSNRVVPGR